MKTFLTALLIVIALAVVVQISPLLIAPFAAGAAVLGGVGSVLLGGIAAVLGVLLAVLTVVLSVAGVAALVLSPVWVPVVLLTLVFRRRAA